MRRCTICASTLPPTSVTLFELIRAQVLPALPAPCLVAPDRTGRSFLVSDFPARYDEKAARAAQDALAALGFSCTVDGSTARIDWTPDALTKWLDSLPSVSLPAPKQDTFVLWGMCRTLLRHNTHSVPMDIAPMRRIFHLICQKDIPALTRALGEALALALRSKSAPPFGLARLVVHLNLLT